MKKPERCLEVLAAHTELRDARSALAAAWRDHDAAVRAGQDASTHALRIEELRQRSIRADVEYCQVLDRAWLALADTGMFSAPEARPRRRRSKAAQKAA